MLKLSKISKIYTLGENTIQALQEVDLEFRKNEFVSILGPSGCGKTTTLNLIGGLDRYTSGDMTINGRSTKEYTDRDWDRYRNHSIGFVFQNYNLIPHQSILSNVELALTLSGVSKEERKQRAQEALKQVGLEDQMYKKPMQLSGGQMQRVAIARALINNPEILLADEPTGALDSETSIQVMELLKQVAKSRLVIMVTHNPELAEKYSTRIIRLKDGRVVGDSDPYHGEQEKEILPHSVEKGRTSMSFFTAFFLSLNNLMTKKGRTILTAFAGSIGIIGIALILSLSSGINNYIEQVEEETLSSYPITIEAESTDMSTMISSMMGIRQQEETDQRKEDEIYSSDIMFDLLDSMMNAETVTNNLEAFKEYIDDNENEFLNYGTIHYGYDLNFDVYCQDANGEILKSDITDLMETAMESMYGGDYSSYFESMGSMYESMEIWEELLPGGTSDTVASQVQNEYDLLYGKWPEAYNQVILFVDQNHELPDLILYALGLLPEQEMKDTLQTIQNGESVENKSYSWSYEDLCGTKFKMVLPVEYYQYNEETKTYRNLAETDAGLDLLYHSGDTGISLEIVGIACSKSNVSVSMLSGGIGYTNALTEYAIEMVNQSDLIQKQIANRETDILSGLPFPKEDLKDPSVDEKKRIINEEIDSWSTEEKADAYLTVSCVPETEYVDTLVEEQLKDLKRDDVEAMILEQYASQMEIDAEQLKSYIKEMSDEDLMSRVEEALKERIRQTYAESVVEQMRLLSVDQLASAMDVSLEQNAFSVEQYAFLYDQYMPATVSESTYQDNLDLLGYVDVDHPSEISFYANSFEEKEKIAEGIETYNDGVSLEEDKITYTDYVALLMSSITDIISGISYLLIGFVSISLIVSSIMIGIITYISVLERTKEIGILRSIGASKRDISRVFNAETFIVGLFAGIFGIAITLILLLPINYAIQSLTGLTELYAVLPFLGGILLIIISIVLTVVAGLIPSRIAAKKDPVEALRAE